MGPTTEAPAIAKPILYFCRPDEETLRIRLGEEPLGTVTHDGIGWSGMAAVEALLTQFAARLGVAVAELDTEDDDD